jgi:hypothetical protein
MIFGIETYFSTISRRQLKSIKRNVGLTAGDEISDDFGTT